MFEVKDSGVRQEFKGGMLRDTQEGKVDWWRVAVGPMLERWAVHLTKGNTKYPDVKPGVPNWTLAEGDEEYERFRQSAFRHFMQWFNGATDEDHAAAVMFNVNGAEYVKGKEVRFDYIPLITYDGGMICGCEFCRASRGEFGTSEGTPSAHSTD